MCWPPQEYWGEVSASEEEKKGVSYHHSFGVGLCLYRFPGRLYFRLGLFGPENRAISGGYYGKPVGKGGAGQRLSGFDVGGIQPDGIDGAVIRCSFLHQCGLHPGAAAVDAVQIGVPGSVVSGQGVGIGGIGYSYSSSPNRCSTQFSSSVRGQ